MLFQTTFYVFSPGSTDEMFEEMLCAVVRFIASSDV